MASWWCSMTPGDGRPLFNELMFGRRHPTYVAFDLLIADGVDLRPLPLWERKARLAAIGKGPEAWIALTNGGIVAKLNDAYQPKLARWHKISYRGYSQRHGRAEWFRERAGRAL